MNQFDGNNVCYKYCRKQKEKIENVGVGIKYKTACDKKNCFNFQIFRTIIQNTKKYKEGNK